MPAHLVMPIENEIGVTLGDEERRVLTSPELLGVVPEGKFSYKPSGKDVMDRSTRRCGIAWKSKG